MTFIMSCLYLKREIPANNNCNHLDKTNETDNEKINLLLKTEDIYPNKVFMEKLSEQNTSLQTLRENAKKIIIDPKKLEPRGDDHNSHHS